MVLEYCFASKRLWYPVEGALHQPQIWFQGLDHPQGQLTLGKTFRPLSPSVPSGK